MNILFWLQVITLWVFLKLAIPWVRGTELPWLPELDIWCLWAWTLVISLRLVDAYKTRVDLPGPLTWALSDSPRMLSTLGGFHRDELLALHEEYGKVVRIGTRELSFNTVQALKDIYQNGAWTFTKDPRMYSRSLSGEYDIKDTPDRRQHANYLRDFGPAFTEDAVSEQEALVQSHGDHLIAKLKAISLPSNTSARPTVTVDMQNVVNLLTGDIAEDLLTGSAGMADPKAASSAGSPHTGIERGKLSPWLLDLKRRLRTPAETMAKIDVLGLSAANTRRLISFIYPNEVKRNQDDVAPAVIRLPERYALGLSKSDWLTPFLEHLINNPPQTKEQQASTLREVQANVTLLQFAGSQATATTLAGVFYFLGCFKDVLSQLTDEVRLRFSRDDKITFAKLAKMPYLDAVINETLRLYPPLPVGLPRVATREALVDGVLVPKGTTVSVTPFVMGRTSLFFHQPYQFAPERWLQPTPSAFANDVLEASAPFSVGPRACLGRSFAYAEVRLVVAKVLFHFDVELCEGVGKWVDGQRSWVYWEKTPLRVRLTERRV